MRKILRLTTFIILACMIFSCSNEENSTNELIAPTSSVLLPPLNKPQTMQKDGITLVYVDIGRESKGCEKFGVCRFCLVCDPNPQPSDEELAQLINDQISNATNQAQSMPHDSHLIFELSEELDPNIYDTNFYVDQNVYEDENGLFYIPADIYPLERNIGEFGGYRLPLVSTQQ